MPMDFVKSWKEVFFVNSPRDGRAQLAAASLYKEAKCEVVQDKAGVCVRVCVYQNLPETTEACITRRHRKMAFLQSVGQPTVQLHMDQRIL